MTLLSPELLQGGVWRVGARDIAGYVYDPSEPSRRFIVELLIDGLSAGLARADAPVRGAPSTLVLPDQLGDCGFAFALKFDFFARVEARVANHNVAIGAPLRWSGEAPIAGPQGPGEVYWDGGLRLSGWVAGEGGTPKRVRAMVDGVVVAESLATGWSHVGDGDAARAVRQFDVDLPRRFADGRVHFVEIRDETGVELAASPCALVAYDRGLTHFLTECGDIAGQRPLVEMFEKITPQSLPLADFRAWRDAFPPPAVAADDRAGIAVALIGEDNLDATLASLEAQQGVAWVAAALERGASPVDFDGDLLRGFLDGEAAEAEALVFVPAGARLAPNALAQISAALSAWPDAPFVYADFAIVAEDGGVWPVALPAYDYERHLEQGYCALFFAARRDLVARALAEGACDLFRLALTAQDVRPTPVPVHLPLFLAELPRPDSAALAGPLAAAARAHLAVRGVGAGVAVENGALLPSVQVGRALGREKISILIPTRDRADLVRRALESLARSVDPARCEILIIDNESVEAETLALFTEIVRRGGRIVPAPGPFNFSRLINLGAAAARGDHLLLLNNDIEALRPGWLEEMLSRLQEPDVGAVGAALLWPSGVVQHGGVVLGPKFAAVHAFNDRIDADPGYGDLLRVAHECSAVTAACLLTPHALFDQVGGFDELRFPVNFNDVDYCLKLRALGRRIVQTPRARLLHRESASRGTDRRPDQAERFLRELRFLRARWGEALAADPYYNPQLALNQTPFAALAFPPAPREARRSDGSPPRAIPPGF